MLGLIRGWWSVCAVFVAVLVGACTIEDPARPDVERLMTVLCEQTESCRCAGSQDMNACDVRRERWDARLDYGRAKGLVFAEQCIEQIEARVQTHACLDATIDGQDGVGHLCDGFCAVFHGDVEAGGECEGLDAITSNCAQGATCLDGTCVQPCEALAGLPEGALCRDEDGNDFDDCAENLLCDFETRQCRTLPGVGGRCANGDCSRDAFCDWNTETCRAAAEVGETCDELACVDGAYCRWNQKSGVCVPEGQVGDACDDVRCADDLVCDFNRNACARAAAEGERCTSVSCDVGLACVEEICRTPPEQGEACAGTCAAGLWCDWEIQRCAPLPDGEGQPCPNGECGGRLWCDTANTPEGECRLRAPFAEPCTGHRQCETGFCPAGFCDELPLLGESCAQANACANGLVCDGETCVTALNRGSAVCSFAGW